MCFRFRFTVVMYRGHILAEWENILDIADIDGHRRGGQDFFYPRYRIIKLYLAQNVKLSTIRGY
jgi:hypothetical protein